MNKIFSRSFFILLVAFTCAHCSKAQSLKVVIIRHGEKPDRGDNLSCMGLNRAEQLPAVLNQKIGMPSKIYVPSLRTGKSTNAARMYQTIVPFAVKYNLDINTKFEVDDYEGLTAAIKKQTGTVLLVWEHKAIDNIARALGVADSGKWTDDDFDSIWIINYVNGKGTLTREKEGLHPAAACQ